MPDISIQNLRFAYEDGRPVLNGVTLDIADGSFVSLLGPSGCGKSTLLRILAGLSAPTAGTVILDGAPVTGPGLDRGVVFQDYSLFPWLSVGENIALAIRQARPGIPRARARELAGDYLGLVNLADAFAKLPRELSGGMRQRGAIARTLALGSPTLLLDEPFGALDPVNRLRMQDLLRGLFVKSSPRKTVVFVTHDVEEALFLGERVIVLGATSGQVIADLPAPFGAERGRDTLYASRAFTELRDRVFEAYHRDLRDFIAAPAIVASPSEGI
jgi:NitT/TauT family transport system ATP-binding protein